MKPLLLGFLLAASALAQTSSLAFYVNDTTGTAPDTPLPSIYQLGSVAQGSESTLTLKVVNTSNNTIYITTVYVSNTAGATDVNQNFVIPDNYYQLSLAPGGSTIFNVYFRPAVIGPVTGYLQVNYQIQQSTCGFNSLDSPCPQSVDSISTLTGTGTEPAVVLSYVTPDSSTPITPAAGSMISFGNVSTSANSSFTFTLVNQSSSTVVVPLSLNVPQYFSSAFSLDQTSITLQPNASGSFKVTFSPGQTGLATATDLVVGTNRYSLTGAGVVVADIDALQIFYVDSTAVRTTPQPATPISFGQLVAGASANSVLVFTVTNPLTSFNAITVPNLTVTGAGFAISGAPTIPASLAPGASFTFSLTFAPAAVQPYSGTLSIGGRQFPLAGQGTNSPITGGPLSGIAFSISPAVPVSGANGTVTLTLTGGPAQFDAIGGKLSMSFKPLNTTVATDPAIVFTANGLSYLPSLTFAKGSQVATYKDASGNVQSSFTFQTGTTAGTINFTVDGFVQTAPYSKSYTIPATAVQISQSSAVRSSPNLIITLNGYDNTYSTGMLSFTFKDTSGSVIGAPIPFDATDKFHNYFFTNNQYGGAFSLIATFPVTGDITKIGSVAVTLTNSTGQATVNQTFQ